MVDAARRLVVRGAGARGVPDGLVRLGEPHVCDRAALAGLAHPHRHDHPPSGRRPRGAGEPRDRVHRLLGAAPSARPLRRARAVEAAGAARALLRARRAAQPAGAAGGRREHASRVALDWWVWSGEAAGRLRRAAQPRRVRRHRRRRRRLHLALGAHDRRAPRRGDGGCAVALDARLGAAAGVGAAAGGADDRGRRCRRRRPDQLRRVPGDPDALPRGLVVGL